MSARSRQGYKSALGSLAARTGTPLPSLIVSFAILHEITALVPLIGICLGAKYLGVGERLVESIRAETHTDAASSNRPPMTEWARKKVGTWITEGEVRTERAGRKYGVFGYPRTPKGVKYEPTEGERGPGVAGDVANVVLAYTATKVSATRLPTRWWIDELTSLGRLLSQSDSGCLFTLARHFRGKS